MHAGVCTRAAAAAWGHGGAAGVAINERIPLRSVERMHAEVQMQVHHHEGRRPEGGSGNAGFESAGLVGMLADGLQ